MLYYIILLIVVVGLHRKVSRTVVVRYWYVHVEVEGHVDGHFRGVCLVARSGFGCGALGLAGTCGQGSADSVGSASAVAGGRGSAVTVCRFSLTGAELIATFYV